MGRFPVRAAKEEALMRRMNELGVREEDIEERFMTASGPGGQHVNRTATCVQLRHVPTGIVVKAQTERSQGLNRFFARRALVEKIEEKLLGKKSPEELKREKIRKQKKRRKRKAKAKVEEAPQKVEQMDAKVDAAAEEQSPKEGEGGEESAE